MAKHHYNTADNPVASLHDSTDTRTGKKFADMPIKEAPPVANEITTTHPAEHGRNPSGK